MFLCYMICCQSSSIFGLLSAGHWRKRVVDPFLVTYALDSRKPICSNLARAVAMISWRQE